MSSPLCCPLHSYYLAGSFAVRSGDHLRSNLGIICGRGSFATLYSPPVSVFIRPVRRAAQKKNYSISLFPPDRLRRRLVFYCTNYVLTHLRKHTSFTLSHNKTETISPVRLKQESFQQYRRDELVVAEVYIRIQNVLFHFLCYPFA